ncbi:hypothetical protein [Arthrobacter sp. ISL-72]|uniref:hypothetical protein n=1 Tax=Arthrobacter sp. ISL-72 TaxID=2819114 RepID=UPI002036244E|nr:hypothetical protein [Arthrobacter sp. ISL-72]
MLAPKRKKIQEVPADAETTRPIERALLAIATEPSSERKHVDASASSDVLGAEQGTEEPSKPQKSAANAASSSPTQQKYKTPANSRKKASEMVPGAPRNVGVYLAPELLVDVKEAVHRQRITYADLLLDAFDTLDEDVIIREFRSESVPSSSGMPRRVPRRRGSAGIQIQVRLDDEQIAWLDQKVVEFSAPSRSALVATTYKLHLTKG